MSTSSTRGALRQDFIKDYLSRETQEAAKILAAEILKVRPRSAILLYGSGNSVLKDAAVDAVLFDFYVIAPDYDAAYRSRLLKIANILLPPNVFYIECESPLGRLRAKYAVLSITHFEKLVSRRTFHSYFWARFAQPSRIVVASDALKARVESAVAAAIDSFVARSAGLVGEGATVGEIWSAGLQRSYKAELRAEGEGRVAKLLQSYGDWPSRVTLPEVARAPTARADLAWRLRAPLGAVLSAARLLKGSLTFEGGVDYIAWKISRHAGFKLPVKEWERRWPLVSWPILARRYYRMKRDAGARGSGAAAS